MKSKTVPVVPGKEYTIGIGGGGSAGSWQCPEGAASVIISGGGAGGGGGRDVPDTRAWKNYPLEDLTADELLEAVEDTAGFSEATSLAIRREVRRRLELVPVPPHTVARKIHEE